MVCPHLGEDDPEDRWRAGAACEGLENLDYSQPAVYAANHLSALDIPVLYATLPVQFRIMAKKELFRLSVSGLASEALGTDPVDQATRTPRCAA